MSDKLKFRSFDGAELLQVVPASSPKGIGLRVALVATWMTRAAIPVSRTMTGATARAALNVEGAFRVLPVLAGQFVAALQILVLELGHVAPLRHGLVLPQCYPMSRQPYKTAAKCDRVLNG